ncbi:MAG TPA: GIY-YIG nuclease family protein [Candidatus Marinimicrobia bacterium]|nr:GIY-YIG nuclease family protein [Candidatus Neomarinimicrobiota bacterium]
MWSVYVIRSLKDGRYYVGMSEDVSQRLKTHSSGKDTSTKSRRPFELMGEN